MAIGLGCWFLCQVTKFIELAVEWYWDCSFFRVIFLSCNIWCTAGWIRSTMLKLCSLRYELSFRRSVSTVQIVFDSIQDSLLSIGIAASLLPPLQRGCLRIGSDATRPAWVRPKAGGSPLIRNGALSWHYLFFNLFFIFSQAASTL